ncbi:MAG: hypothetical protein M3O46_11955, partial [Myxococcota bacterium]|nr:hypothetical protein [Myxococcota bacterium]
MRLAPTRVVLVALILCISRLAIADDAGEGGTKDDSGSEASGDEASVVDGGMNRAPIACDGALCDTTNGAGCGLVDRPFMGSPFA